MIHAKPAEKTKVKFILQFVFQIVSLTSPSDGA